MLSIVVRDGNLDRALSALKKKLAKDRASVEARVRGYAKPSERRRRKELEAKKLKKKAEKRRQYRADENRARKKVRPDTYDRLMVDVRA